MIDQVFRNNSKEFTMMPKIKIWAENEDSFAVTILYPKCWSLENKDTILSKEYLDKNFKVEE